MISYNKEKMSELDFSLLREKYSEDELVEILKKIDDDYPVQYAIGDVDFLGYKIKVDERVLVPRFETELLVDKLSKYMERIPLSSYRILDVCTGSGCIGVALAKKFPSSSVMAVDLSSDALSLARENALLNEVNVDFFEVDALKDLNMFTDIDVLVANPPYVKIGEIVSKNTRYEPQMALYPGIDDVIFYRRILEQAKDILNKKSIIAFEIGSTQGKEVVELVKKHFPQSRVVIEKDYAELDRFVFIFNGFFE